MTVFHRDPPPWFESIKDLKPGAKRRIADGVMASFNGRAYHRWDFREKTSEVYEPQMTLAQKLQHIKAAQQAELSAANSHELPFIMTAPSDWPVAARVWLHKAGIDNNNIAEYGIGWNPDMQRVIIPLNFVDGSNAWLGRDVDTGRAGSPKYLFPEGMKRGGGAFIRGWGVPVPAHSELVVTEDWLSGLRVARDNDNDVVVALGTSLDRDAMVSIAQKWQKVAVWLDPDYYGQLGARRIVADLRRLGVPQVRNIVSDVDPKLHTPADIRKYLE